MASLDVALLEANAHRQYVIIWYLGSLRPPLLPVRQMTPVEAVGNVASPYSHMLVRESKRAGQGLKDETTASQSCNERREQHDASSQYSAGSWRAREEGRGHRHISILSPWP
jgi:hypothetical protein